MEISFKFVLISRIFDADERRLELEQKVKDLEKEKDEMVQRLVQVNHHSFVIVKLFTINQGFSNLFCPKLKRLI